MRGAAFKWVWGSKKQAAERTRQLEAGVKPVFFVWDQNSKDLGETTMPSSSAYT
ncbi:hypothetical protein SAMN04488112_10518 [Melghirimyces thermohalophilus]|uniref:Uncharacterized protein n=1 Tax=Melghirimyces thermohalophilus TaxID=1236220 RepID=A0A1G6K130_9BACL|nr:hypothetical protein SAMN04488112_10518 [Melghirimyces thermohalophilus]